MLGGGGGVQQCSYIKWPNFFSKTSSVSFCANFAVVVVIFAPTARRRSQKLQFLQVGCNSVLTSSGLIFFPKLVQCPFAPILLLLLLFSHQPQGGALRSCSSYVPDSIACTPS